MGVFLISGTMITFLFLFCLTTTYSLENCQAHMTRSQKIFQKIVEKIVDFKVFSITFAKVLKASTLSLMHTKTLLKVYIQDVPILCCAKSCCRSFFTNNFKTAVVVAFTSSTESNIIPYKVVSTSRKTERAKWTESGE